MLVEAGCRAVIIGHSERRQYFGETDESANKKVKAALAAGLTPILCVGELLAEREGGKMEEVLERQFSGGLAALTGAEFSRIILAYEPVWAIGTGRTATPEMARMRTGSCGSRRRRKFYARTRRRFADPLRRQRQTRQHQGIDGASGN
jgi:triosephosphate isomerase